MNFCDSLNNLQRVVWFTFEHFTQSRIDSPSFWSFARGELNSGNSFATISERLRIANRVEADRVVIIVSGFFPRGCIPSTSLRYLPTRSIIH